MGAIADALVSFGQPLLAATDGSDEQIQKAFALIQVCWNLALVPEREREAVMTEMLGQLGLPDEQVPAMQVTVGRMIARHQQMFPAMHRGAGIAELLGPRLAHLSPPPPRPPREKYPGARRTRPCPCGSGKKYKHCCLAASASIAAIEP